ncbi:hypothetical protein EDD18DRAFT_1135058, partial [Armillaria luteobubalina]
MTRLVQFCTCGAHVFDHVGTYNPYYIPEPWTVLRYFNPDDNNPSPSAMMSGSSNDASSPFSQNITLSSDYSTPVLSNNAMDIPFTPACMLSNTPDTSSSYSYGDAAIFTHPPQPVIQLATPQTEAHSLSEVKNSYRIHFQSEDVNFSVNVQDSRARFQQDHPYRAPHGAEAWAGQF